MSRGTAGSSPTGAHVVRIGFTPVKGGRHRTHGSVFLTGSGPGGDRAFCLVDPATDRCLRTVENPTLLGTSAAWDGTELSVTLPTGTVTGEPSATGESRSVDYWGRTAVVEVVDGPWAAAYSAHLGREVVLAVAAPGAVVYGGPVTLVTRGSLAALSSELGAPVDGARFRATFELDGVDLAPYAEEEWVGRRLLVGEAEVRIRDVVPRCAVVDLEPATGTKDLPVMKALARRSPRDVSFGVDADVTRPGPVPSGAPVRLLD